MRLAGEKNWMRHRFRNAIGRYDSKLSAVGSVSNRMAAPPKPFSSLSGKYLAAFLEAVLLGVEQLNR